MVLSPFSLFVTHSFFGDFVPNLRVGRAPSLQDISQGCDSLRDLRNCGAGVGGSCRRRWWYSRESRLSRVAVQTSPTRPRRSRSRGLLRRGASTWRIGPTLSSRLESRLDRVDYAWTIPERQEEEKTPRRIAVLRELRDTSLASLTKRRRPQPMKGSRESPFSLSIACFDPLLSRIGSPRCNRQSTLPLGAGTPVPFRPAARRGKTESGLRWSTLHYTYIPR